MPTADDEATFIKLWQAGVKTATIAERLAIPLDTAKSPGHTLQ